MIKLISSPNSSFFVQVIHYVLKKFKLFSLASPPNLRWGYATEKMPFEHTPLQRAGNFLSAPASQPDRHQSRTSTNISTIRHKNNNNNSNKVGIRLLTLQQRTRLIQIQRNAISHSLSRTLNQNLQKCLHCSEEGSWWWWLVVMMMPMMTNQIAIDYRIHRSVSKWTILITIHRFVFFCRVAFL